MTDLVFVFPFVVFAGLAFIDSPNPGTQVGGLFLCIAGVLGTASGIPYGGIGYGIGDLTIGVMFKWLIYLFYYGKSSPNSAASDTVECPNCGRQNAQETRICPRCEHRFDAD